MNQIWFPLQRAIRTATHAIIAAAAIHGTTVVVVHKLSSPSRTYFSDRSSTEWGSFVVSARF